MIRLWEKLGTGRPFAKCIITPLFVGPGTLKHIRYMHEAWGVSVTFDSAGFFVQQGKIQYDELFVRLLDFYRQNSWAENYVLPDFVPTSRNTPAEVAERVQVTVAEGLNFYGVCPRTCDCDQWECCRGINQEIWDIASQNLLTKVSDVWALSTLRKAITFAVRSETPSNLRLPKNPPFSRLST